MKKYVITADVGHLMKKWARDNDFVAPSDDFFRKMNIKIAAAVQEAIGGAGIVRILPSEILIDGIVGLVDQHALGLPLVVIDHLFLDMPVANIIFSFHVTRAIQVVEGKYKTVGGRPRPGAKSLEAQAKAIARQVTSPGKEVVIVDDGCYEGNSLRSCAEILVKSGLKIHCAIVGLFREPDELQDFGFPVFHFLKYPKGTMLDWICERDFVPGVPHGGRVIIGDYDEHHYHCAPYLQGFGDINDWASISPEKSFLFSMQVLARTKKMFEEIGALSGKPVLATDIRHWPHFEFRPLPRPADIWFVDALGDVYR